MSCTNFWNPKIGTKKTPSINMQLLYPTIHDPSKNSLFLDIPGVALSIWRNSSFWDDLPFFNFGETHRRESLMDRPEEKNIHPLSWFFPWFTWKWHPWNRRFLEENPSFMGTSWRFFTSPAPENLLGPKRKVDKVVFQSHHFSRGKLLKKRWGVAICTTLLYYTTTINLLRDYRKMS